MLKKVVLIVFSIFLYTNLYWGSISIFGQDQTIKGEVKSNENGSLIKNKNNVRDISIKSNGELVTGTIQVDFELTKELIEKLNGLRQNITNSSLPYIIFDDKTLQVVVNVSSFEEATGMTKLLTILSKEISKSKPISEMHFIKLKTDKGEEILGKLNHLYSMRNEQGKLEAKAPTIIIEKQLKALILIDANQDELKIIKDIVVDLDKPIMK